MRDDAGASAMKSILLVFMLCLATATLAQKKNEEPPKPAQSIAELRQQLEKILQDTHTPGLSVAIVHRDGPEWVAGLGTSNVAANQTATDETLFRIGSVSKGFVSLSVLKLVNEGRLSLNDSVHKLVPEIWFENRWEATDPVRVVDLLEHTTGWDDMHLREYAKNGKGMTLREGLDYDHHSRTSRWRPGTRMAYCNSGPWVAAYIVEKITHQSFEDYVTQNLFLPIGMKTATYFEQPSPQLAALYHLDGKTPYPYWNFMERPSGAINASAKDMAAYVQFYLNRGAVSGRQVVPDVSIDRMETPTRTWQAQEGLKAGYGLSNYTFVHDGFVYHGHSGGNPGAITEMGYMPEYGVGYAYTINAANNEAFTGIGRAVRAYITRGFTRLPVPAAAQLPADAQQYAGWYEPASSRSEWTGFLRLLVLHRIHFERGNLVFSNLYGTFHDTFVPVGGAQFRYLPAEGPAPPIATAALLAPNAEGRFVCLGTVNFSDSATWKRVPTWFAIGKLVLAVWFLLAGVSILLYAPFWIFGGLMRKRRRPAERAMRLLPLIAVLSLIVAQTLFVQAGTDAIARLGNLTIWSFGIFLSTLIFGGSSVASAVALWLARKHEIRSRVRWFSMAVTSALLIATAYFAYWGVIGIHPWF
ncbi:MAG TPA: serine hydrolase domain-containing protein [Candidatus Angelobacter sp.]|nr:serine hydrolase domain-containing protein [Candidatus Angelobacter sp.]